MDLLCRRRLRPESAQVVSCCVDDKPPKNVYHIYGNIPYMFEYCANLVLFFSIFLNGPTRPLFNWFSVFSNKQYNFYNKSNWKNFMPIQYMAQGLEPMPFGTWVSSHNHYTRAPPKRFFESTKFQIIVPWLRFSLAKFCWCRFRSILKGQLHVIIHSLNNPFN